MIPTDIPRRPRLRSRVGRCYELSGFAALTRTDWTLVQGSVRGPQGSRVGHAWIERGGFVYDSVSDEVMPNDAYRERFAVVELGRWQGREVADMLNRHGHWGPWIDDGSAPELR